MEISMQPEQPKRYRSITPTLPGGRQAVSAPMMPGTTMEPPNPTAMVPPAPGVPAPRPNKGIDQQGHGLGEVGAGVMRPIDQNRFRGGREGLPPQMPVGPTHQRPGTVPRPTAGVPRIGQPPAPPVVPPPAPTLPPVEPSRVDPTPPVPLDTGAPEFSANLRSDVYTPGEDKALATAQQGTQTALNNITGAPSYSSAAASGESRYRKLFGDGAVEAGAGVDPTGSNRYLDEQDAAIAGLGGPSRTELAQQTLKDFETQGEAGLANRFRKVGQSAAKFGRIGMGDVNAELGSIQGDYERDLMAKRNELASSVAEGDIADRFRRVDATSGLRRGEAGLESGLRSEARSERDYTTGVGERNADRAFDRSRSAIDYSGRDADRDIQDRYDQYGAAGSLEDRLFSQGQRNRDEYRTERERQDRTEQTSLENRIRERQLGNQEREQRLSRALALMQAGGKAPSLDELLAGG